MAPSGLPCQAHASEDLAALRQVPVAEGQARDARVRSPTSRRAARGSPRRRTPPSTRGRGRRRSPGSRRTCEPSTPTPRRCPPARPAPAGPRSPPSPTRPRWAGARRARGRRRRPRTRRRGRRAPPGGSCRDRGMVRDVVLLLPRPALVRPPLAPLVAAALAEVHPAARCSPGGARSRRRARSTVVAGALVVVGEALRAGAHRERARRDRSSHSLRATGAAAARRSWPARRRAAARRSPASGASSRSAGARGAAPSRRSRRRRRPLAREHLGRARADGRHVVARRRPGRAPRSRRAPRAASRTRRTARASSGRSSSQAAVAVAEPQILVGGDVAEIPDQRAHDRRVHALELLVAEPGDQRERARARLHQVGERLLVLDVERAWAASTGSASRGRRLPIWRRRSRGLLFSTWRWRCSRDRAAQL